MKVEKKTILLNVSGSVADPGCLSRITDLNFSIPAPNFFYPGSASKNLSILNQKIVS
jgi:hypothetical protein